AAMSPARRIRSPSLSPMAPGPARRCTVCWSGRILDRRLAKGVCCMNSFSDPAAVAGYRRRARQQVPGLDDLHRMTGLLLAEHAPADARVLVLGAGGGMELEVLTRMQPGWRFVGVDPSAEMLDLARTSLGDAASRVDFHRGYIDSAPGGPFDAAVCLLTLHFLPAPARLETLRAIAARLRPGAPLVAAHHSFSHEGADG